MQRGFLGLQFGDKIGNAIERLLIQDLAGHLLEAVYLCIDLVALLAHERGPHLRELTPLID